MNFTKRSDHDIGRFDIQMNHTAGMRVGQRLANLFKNLQQTGQIISIRCPPRQQLRQRRPHHKFHRKVRTLIGRISRFINRDDAWMLQPSGDPCFVRKLLMQMKLVQMSLQQKFDGNVAVEFNVAAPEDDAHAAAGNFRIQAEPSKELANHFRIGFTASDRHARHCRRQRFFGTESVGLSIDPKPDPVFFSDGKRIGLVILLGRLLARRAQSRTRSCVRLHRRILRTHARPLSLKFSSSTVTHSTPTAS